MNDPERWRLSALSRMGCPVEVVNDGVATIGVVMICPASMPWARRKSVSVISKFISLLLNREIFERRSEWFLPTNGAKVVAG
ncbi:hypothetical protein KSD_82030 [Ktedonobacter sp. SOSP1-85]|nr:hypothetical protein KSD_82030 [Ktedonobacter sp. SOSP1-85]